ncbi:MAG: DEAD/DEAH box helicase [Candidatus Methanomethylicia archaeon]
MNAFQKLNEKLRRIILDYGYIEPTEPQEKAIPEILNGENILLIAPTGSGKTEAALFPIISMMINENIRGIRAIYITPLRALNRDILKRMVEIAEKTGISIEVRHGDTPESIRRRQALKPPKILITTPETLQAILPGKTIRKHLSKVRYVVIDELHELVSDKRGAQLALALERLEEVCEEEIQRIGLSATIGNRDLAAKFLAGTDRKVKIIDSTEKKNFEINVEAVFDDEENYSEVEGIPVHMVKRLRRIIELASKGNSILLFTNTRETAEALSTMIKKLNPPFKIGVHHGSISKEERIRIEEEFRNGIIKLLICTSSLELGIDIGSIDHVIQYTSPRQATNLMQRVGRSGHKIWETSCGTIIASTIDDIIESAVLAKRVMEKRIEDLKMHEKALDVLAHQMVGLILDLGSINVKDVKRIFSKAYPYRDLKEEDVIEVASFLSEIGVIKYYGEDGNLKVRKNRTWKYYYENLSVIPDTRKFTVISVEDRRPIGNLDEEFVVIHGKEPFILAGRTWNIINIDENELKIYVEYMGEDLAAIPAWIGELIPVPVDVAMEAADLREKIFKGERLSGYPLRGEILGKIRGALNEHVKLGIEIPTSKRVIVEGLGKIIVIHIPLGTNGNRTIASLIALKIHEKLRINVRIASDPYRIALITSRPLNPESIIQIIHEINMEMEDLVKALKNTSEYKWKIFHVARRMGVIEKEAKISRIESIIPYLEGSIVEGEAIREALQDYFEVESVKKYLNDINSGKVEIIVVRRNLNEEISPLTKQILMQTLPQGLIPSSEAPLNLVEIVKERIQNREIILACIHCRKWMGKYRLKYIPDEITCPKCGAKAIGTTYREDILKIIDKKFKGRKLSEDEKKDLENFQKSISLIMSYGKRALIALAARGIGPTTASRILRGPQKTEEEFYLEILEAEKEYLRTRMFWGE